DPEVCNMAVDILTSDDNLVPSKLWQQKDVHVESEVEILSNGVPKAIMLYRSKVIDRMIKVQLQRISDESLSEQEREESVKRMTELINARTKISRESQRLIL
ncbi:MAG: DNA primase, partial [Alistipes sp.]|nr:DNA primase [Alistipes sp.]